MATHVRAKKLHEWALLPEKQSVAPQHARAEARLLEEHFKQRRRIRAKEVCPAWVLGSELGWTLRSPISEQFTPIDEVQLSSDADLTEASRSTGATEFWARGSGFIGTRRNHWLRSYAYRATDGTWESMFLPNGEGTFEWLLGFGLQIPDDYFLLVHEAGGHPDLQIPVGVLTAKQVNRTWEQSGLSIAAKPLAPVKVERGDVIARITLLHRDSLQAQMEIE
ncbi:MAG: hypothetical protein QM619_08690 [Micropruina sp.]|uniref:hypothetical protein n=1 Tax=Micropruina sp. TaxID=2737536 RepID=UPI0039E70C37